MCNFSLWYPYIMQKTGSENTQNQVEVIMIILI